MDGSIPKENIGKKDNEEEIEIPKQNRETEVVIEAENVIGNQDDSEQAVPQKDTNVKDTNICGDMLPKVLNKLKSVKMEGILVKLFYLQWPFSFRIQKETST